MSPTNNGDAGWGEYRRLVLADLARIAADLESLAKQIAEFRADDLAQIKTDIALLKLQAALWGGVAGTVGTLIVGVVTKFLLR